MLNPPKRHIWLSNSLSLPQETANVDLDGNWPIKSEWPMISYHGKCLAFEDKIWNRRIFVSWKMYLLLQEGKPEIKSVTKAAEFRNIKCLISPKSNRVNRSLAFRNDYFLCQNTMGLWTGASRPTVMSQSWKAITCIFRMSHHSLLANLLDHILRLVAWFPGWSSCCWSFTFHAVYFH